MSFNHEAVPEKTTGNPWPYLFVLFILVFCLCSSWQIKFSNGYVLNTGKYVQENRLTNCFSQNSYNMKSGDFYFVDIKPGHCAEIQQTLIVGNYDSEIPDLAAIGTIHGSDSTFFWESDEYTFEISKSDGSTAPTDNFTVKVTKK